MRKKLRSVYILRWSSFVVNSICALDQKCISEIMLKYSKCHKTAPYLT